ncbi:MAG: hypothetical protein D6811_04470 [Alphaproteobacteria bacterium]|nr:MAG: hypothetical protein D6811_04470 [Alphaproteobacteria bacterium]
MLALVSGAGAARAAGEAEGPNCAERARVLEQLAGRYGETRQSMGLASNNALIEVFASEETGSWTITMTLPSGLTCLIASGQAYERLREALPGSRKEA